MSGQEARSAASPSPGDTIRRVTRNWLGHEAERDHRERMQRAVDNAVGELEAALAVPSEPTAAYNDGLPLSRRRHRDFAATRFPRHPDEPMEPLKNPNFVFGLREGARLELPATDLTAWERVVLVASIARALDLPDVDRHIRSEWWWAS